MLPVDAIVFAALFLACTAWGVRAFRRSGPRMIATALTCALASYVAFLLARPMSPYGATSAFLLVDVAIVVLAMHFVMRLLGGFDEQRRDEPGDDFRRGDDDDDDIPRAPKGSGPGCHRPARRAGYTRVHAVPRRENAGSTHHGRPVRRGQPARQPSRRHAPAPRPTLPR